MEMELEKNNQLEHQHRDTDMGVMHLTSVRQSPGPQKEGS
jgi:hypothetical protein